MTTERRSYSVFRGNAKEPVLVTEGHSRAIEAMDSMFDRGFATEYDRPESARIECDGQVIEMRKKDKALKMLEAPPAEQHHHAAPYIPSIAPLQPKHRRPGVRA